MNALLLFFFLSLIITIVELESKYYVLIFTFNFKIKFHQITINTRNQKGTRKILLK